MDNKTNEKRLGNHQKNMLDFTRKFPGWHGINKDALTQRVARSLVKRNLIELNLYGQIRIKES